MEILWLQEMGTQNHIQLQSKGKSKLKTSLAKHYERKMKLVAFILIS